jgi:hypothetical protein
MSGTPPDFSQFVKPVVMYEEPPPVDDRAPVKSPFIQERIDRKKTRRPWVLEDDNGEHKYIGSEGDPKSQYGFVFLQNKSIHNVDFSSGDSLMLSLPGV